MSENSSASAEPPVQTIAGPVADLAYKARPGRSPTVVFLPGFKSHMDGTKATALDRWAAANGRACLRLDYAGHGSSGGTHEAGTISSWRDDALAVIDQATEGTLVLVGSSMGGWIMLLIALARRDRTAGLVGIAAAPDATRDLLWRRLEPDARALIETQGYVDIASNYEADPVRITRALIEDGDRNIVLDGSIDLDMPVRLIHGMADPDVPWSQSRRLAERLNSEDVRVTLIKSGDHRLSRPEELTLIEQAVGELCDRASGDHSAIEGS